MLADGLPCILDLLGGLFRHSKLDHLVLCVCESAEKLNQGW